MPRPLPHPQQLPGVLQTTGHSRAGLGYGGVDGKVWGNPHFSHGTKLDPGVADPVEIRALEVSAVTENCRSRMVGGVRGWDAPTECTKGAMSTSV